MAKPMTRQPQGTVLINWANPISKAIACILVPQPSGAIGWLADGTSRRPYTEATGTYVTGSVGISPVGFNVRPVNTTYGYAFNISNLAALQSQNYSLFAVATIAPNGNPQSILDDDDGNNRRFQFRLNGSATSLKAEFIPFSGGNATSISPSTPYPATAASKGLTIGATAGPGIAKVFQGKTIASANVTAQTPNNFFYVGARKTGSQWLLGGGGISLVIVWSRTLTDAEMLSMADNPWQLFLDTDDYPEEFLLYLAGQLQAQVRRALYMDGQGYYLQAADGVTGIKPLVLLNGDISERISTSQGVPIVLIDGYLKTLAANEVLNVDK